MISLLSILSTGALIPPTFCFWAEENSDIGHHSDQDHSSSESEWSFGNGATGYPLERGIVIGVPFCKVISMTLSVGRGTVHIRKSFLDHDSGEKIGGVSHMFIRIR